MPREDVQALEKQPGAVAAAKLPFNAALLDDLMDEAGLDVLLVSSKHNLQYLLGGYKFFFFEHFDAIGISRYLPLLIYRRGRTEDAVYIGNPMENYERELGKFWVPSLEMQSGGSVDTIERAVRHLSRLGIKKGKIGAELAFLPGDAYAALKSGLPGCEIVEAHFPLERLRARKTPAELALVREASVRVIDSMLAVMGSHGPGTTKIELVEALRREETQRGLTFEYCLITAGTSRNRAASTQTWDRGQILSLDSGGNYKGYIGDLCRMAILGQPDAELVELLAEVDAIQQAARKPIRHGARGGDIFAAVEEPLRRSPNNNNIEFVAHGMGLISHEAPRLTSRGPVAYPAHDAELPLQSGMVLSIETTIGHPRRGFIKLEDTVAVTEDGWEGFGDYGRGWNQGNLS
ncbi:MAG: aminopeptidase P family protein [Methylobacteriaceae bacterium]|nr:aminopeptidase P family protein [Methylobacteriaceae bacterium]MBV9244895.1 aminopeptidase P family protein [Methylobacteriaceae bacterium]